MLDTALLRVRTVHALGLQNVARVALYRLGLKLGLNPAQRLRSVLPEPPYFAAPARSGGSPEVAPRDCSQLACFGWKPVPLDGTPPDWHQNIISGVSLSTPHLPWWEIPDFNPAIGDIKTVWELSRWDWVVQLAQGAAQGESSCLERLNQWIGDWARHNPAYRGPNWKCGQEASIRVMHLALGALILRQHQSASPALGELVKVHLRRIEPTLRYAVAQDNNHGTSEAAALFVGGTWLDSLAPDSEHARWARLGRRWLENRAERLIEPDGSFSQYSVNYHRFMLDTLSTAELWRAKLGLPPFSRRFRRKATAATEWLRAFVQDDGDAPNIGANDGAQLLRLSDTGYRDFRPSVQLGSTLFSGKPAYAADGRWNDPLRWLGIPVPEGEPESQGSRLFDHGGYAVLRAQPAVAYLRYPRFRFRPGQADALHVDLWVGGDNLLRDAGSYSYNAKPRWQEYFSGTQGHNTVQFDGRQQMPRLGRFLYGDWLGVTAPPVLEQKGSRVECAAGYADNHGAAHQRRISLSADRLLVHDQVKGFREKAVLRWRLSPGNWRVDGNSVSDGGRTITVSADVPIARFELTTGWESRYYLQKTQVPVLEVEVRRPGVLESRVLWQSER